MSLDGSSQVTCGYGSGALVQFFSTGLTQPQLARMRKSVDTGTGQVRLAFVDSTVSTPVYLFGPRLRVATYVALRRVVFLFSFVGSNL